ncbi:hypothetical protein, partial [uncultured Akkermansia sp.]
KYRNNLSRISQLSCAVTSGMERRGFLHFGGGLTPNSQDARKLLERSTLLINRQRVMMAADTVMPINS